MAVEIGSAVSVSDGFYWIIILIFPLLPVLTTPPRLQHSSPPHRHIVMKRKPTFLFFHLLSFVARNNFPFNFGLDDPPTASSRMQIWTGLLHVTRRFVWEHLQAAIVIMGSALFFYKTHSIHSTRWRMRNIVQDQVVSFYHFNKNPTLATPLWRHDDRMKRRIQSWSEKEWNVILWKENFILSTVNRGLWEGGQEEIMLGYGFVVVGRTGQCYSPVSAACHTTQSTQNGECHRVNLLWNIKKWPRLAQL